MKNITVTLDEKTASWARIYAARQNKSLSKFLGDLLHRTMHESREYEEAMRQFLDKKPRKTNKGNAAYPAREALHDRLGIR